jgi:hypothetical protein
MIIRSQGLEASSVEWLDALKVGEEAVIEAFELRGMEVDSPRENLLAAELEATCMMLLLKAEVHCHMKRRGLWRSSGMKKEIDQQDVNSGYHNRQSDAIVIQPQEERAFPQGDQSLDSEPEQPRLQESDVIMIHPQ